MSDDHSKLKRIPTVKKWKLLKWVIPLVSNPLPTGLKFLNRHENLLYLKFLPKSRFIVCNHPQYVKHVLKTNQDNYSRKKVLGNLSELLGEGLFSSEGELWKKQHKLIKPSLHEKFIRDYFTTIDKETQVLITKWKEHARENKEVDIEYDINVLMLRILIKTQLNGTVAIDFDEIIALMRVILTQSSPFVILMDKTVNQVLSFFKLPVRENKKIKTALSRLNEIVGEIRKVASKNPDSMGLVLEILEQEKNEGGISDQQVIDEIKNFFFAGFDTTASALSWALTCVSRKSEQAALLKKEVDEVLEQKSPRMEHLGSMSYTKMFIQESMRLYPPVFLLVRESILDDEINGYFIPKKHWVLINVYALHRHPELWEDPEKFNPLRFQPNTFKDKAFAYIPFGQGKRSCIGKPLAMAELQIILPLLIQNFNFKMVNNKEPKINPHIIIKAKKKLMMKLTLR